jgi:hypothetical protein
MENPYLDYWTLAGTGMMQVRCVYHEADRSLTRLAVGELALKMENPYLDFWT